MFSVPFVHHFFHNIEYIGKISLLDEIMTKNNTKSMRITITLKKEIYDKVGEICTQVGLKPATWITMVVTSKVNKVDESIIQERK